MPAAWAALGAAVVGGAASVYSSNKAAGAQKKAAASAQKFQGDQAAQTRADLEPWRQAGMGAESAYGNAIGLNGLGPQQAAMDAYQHDPAFARQQEDIMNSVQGSALARGGLLSGNTLRGISDQQQHNWNTGWQQHLTNLQNTASRGLGAATNGASLGQNSANAQSNAALEYGAARGAGYAAMGNNINSSIENALGAYMKYKGQQDGSIKKSGSP